MLIRNAQVAHNFFTIAWFQKISRPSPQREMEIPGGLGGGGGSEAQEIPEGMEVGQLNHFPRG